MTDCNLVVLYVKDSAVSSRPPSSTPNFALLPLGRQAMLGLWQCEVAFTVANAEAVRATHEASKRAAQRSRKRRRR